MVVDAAGYRARREEALAAIANRGAEQAISLGASVRRVEPMTAMETQGRARLLKDYAGVVTRSEGTEPNRFVVIDPVVIERWLDEEAVATPGLTWLRDEARRSAWSRSGSPAFGCDPDRSATSSRSVWRAVSSKSSSLL